MFWGLSLVVNIRINFASVLADARRVGRYLNRFKIGYKQNCFFQKKIYRSKANVVVFFLPFSLCHAEKNLHGDSRQYSEFFSMGSVRHPNPEEGEKPNYEPQEESKEKVTRRTHDCVKLCCACVCMRVPVWGSVPQNSIVVIAVVITIVEVKSTP